MKIKQIGQSIRKKNKELSEQFEVRYFKSVSKICSSMYKPFDSFRVAQNVFDKNFNNPNSEYYQKSVEEIVKEWDLKARIGQTNGKMLDNLMQTTFKVHESNDNRDLIRSIQQTYEYYIKSGDFKSAWINRSFTSEEQINESILKYQNFYKSISSICKKQFKLNEGTSGEKYLSGKFDFVDSEVDIICPFFKYKGRLDALFSLKVGEREILFLVDFKNNKKLTTENGYEKMLGNLSEFDASDLNKYTLQIYLYLYALRNVYEYEGEVKPLVMNITTEGMNFLTPTIPYSDELVEQICKFAGCK